MNYRSVPAILAEVGRVFPPVMQAAEGMQPAFEPLVASPQNEAAPGFCEGSSSPVEYWLAWRRDAEAGTFDTDLRAGPSYELEATALADDVLRQHDEHGVPWGDMAVLLRTSTGLDRILEALRQRAIPYEVERDRSYYRRREGRHRWYITGRAVP